MRAKAFLATTALTTVICNPATAQTADLNYGQFGLPGLVDMPIAQSAPEGEIASTIVLRDGLFRLNFAGQLTDRLSGSASLTVADIYDGTGIGIDEGEFERSFSLQYRLINESEYMPAVAIGMRDFLNPGRFQSEYVVATKSIGDNLAVTAGLGWGAMGTHGGFDNPIGSRPTRPTFDETTPEGQLATDQWFAGDAAFFGGASYQINDKWGVLAEYSSIAYPQEAYAPVLDVSSPYNFGVTYRPLDGVQLTLASLHGSAVSLSGTFVLNANNRPGMSGIEGAPAPIKVRSENARAAQTWDRSALPPAALQAALQALLDVEGIRLTGLEITDTTARVRYENNRYRSQAQALGRVSRMMTQIMPGAVETFILEPEQRGIPLSATTIRRSDLEALENRGGASEAMFARAQFSDAGTDAGLTEIAPQTPAFSWGFSPYFALSSLGSDGGMSVDGGIKLQAQYRISPQTVISGAIVQSLLKNDGLDPVVDSTPQLQNVRTDGGFYGDDGVPVLQSLAITHYGRPGPNLYSRVSAGYLESMYGGISTELLWKPVDSSFGLGAELNYVAQRDTDMGFGFDEYDYDVLTGHVSAYYDFGGGYHSQLDVGRYLAGDWGGKITLAREYDNGVEISAYVSQTEVNYEDFGDGSYNKGVRISIPQDFLTGSPSRKDYGATLRSRVGDGGAMLNIDGRLYDIVRDAHRDDLNDTWGRFWR
ncbi:Exopolysaccharide biosynthesis protein YbjH [Yoonia tamlensis]|uniref:Exopolysaccharide biosynthesis protein YbjH n=1 Tax=Yoonia tamlensis TaxID=390270 RepID=A0A1I6HMH7_9RHOB|nr:YjbH domain-containing protein [Yoonia tamlensis]SFR55547.1 Exopolysaccharide biosynthesis protein YbjH [Yoonia tamlensis]